MGYREEVRRFYLKHRQDGETAVNALRGAKWDARYDPQAKSNKHAILPSRYDAYDGQETTTLPNGWKIKVEFGHDSDMNPPWENCDGMGMVKEYHGYGGPGEHGEYDAWILNSERSWYRYYDWKATLPEAIRDGWNTKPYNFRTNHERAMAAMKSTYEYLRRWCNDDWWYVGMIVTILDADDNELAEESVWGFESCCMDYLCREARSWAARMLRKERRARRDAAMAEKIANRFHDAMKCGV